MRKIALLKRRYNRTKRRIALGDAKPGDDALLKKLSVQLGYIKLRSPADG